MADFDYTSPAELFVGKGRGSSGGSHMMYRRFPTSAEAIKYAVETLKADFASECGTCRWRGSIQRRADPRTL